MSKNRPLSVRDALAVAAAVAVVVLVIVTLHEIRDRAPANPLDPVAQPAHEHPASDPGFVTCERTLPDRPTRPPGVEPITPIGRVQSTEVLDCPAEFDGHVVQYLGEVVGDVLRRRGGAWVLMNDDEYALGAGPLPAHREFGGSNTGLAVWLEGDLADLVERAGGPGWRGDILLVTGLLHRVDPHDGGGLTIRALAGEVVAPAQPTDVPVNRLQAVFAVLLAAAAIALVVLERLRARTR